MSMTVSDLLQPQVILDIVSRVRKNQGRLGKWLGFHTTGFDKDGGTLTGPNVKTGSMDPETRTISYRIMDSTRTVAMARAPGTGPATHTPQAIGDASITVARFHEKIRLDAELLSNMSKVVGPNTALDPDGQDYAVRQQQYMAARFNNAIELMAAGLIRGKFYLKNSGENWIPVLAQPGGTTPYVTCDFQVPSGNLSQLNMLGAGDIINVTWSNPAAKIISLHLPKIAIAFVQLTGMALTDIWVDPLTWGYVVNNTEVINTGGSSNTPFSEFAYTRDQGDDGKQVVEWVAVLRGYPTVRWHISADVLVADGGTDPSYTAGTGTLTQIIPANSAIFMGEVDGEWADLVTCSELVCENPGMPMVRRSGFYAWTEFITQPSAIELIGLLNAIPRARKPKAICNGTVVF